MGYVVAIGDTIDELNGIVLEEGWLNFIEELNVIFVCQALNINFFLVFLAIL
jgi:hypothetical protein